MQVLQHPYQLVFKHPFGVSSNTRTETTSIFVRIGSESHVGYGEACLPAYLGETAEETSKFIRRAGEFLLQYDPVLPIKFFLEEIDRMSTGHHAAKAAIDIALHDLYGKLANMSYPQMMGIGAPPTVPTSFTIGIDTEEKIAAKIKEAADFSVLKIKAGTSDDKALIQLVRKYTDKPLYVDVNQGWTDKHYVLEMLHWLKEQNVILVEQPMPKGMHAEMKWVTDESPIPTIADESVKRLADLEKMDGAFDGINIKLMKCTGLREAMKMIQYCKKNRIMILLGCMAESSCATTAMAQLVGFADYVDLDAPLLYTNDPFEGIAYNKGRITLPKFPGIGAKPIEDLFRF